MKDMEEVDASGKAGIFDAIVRAAKRGFSVQIEPAPAIDYVDFDETVFVLVISGDIYHSALLVKDVEHEDWKIEEWLEEQEAAIRTKIIQGGGLEK